MAFPLACQAGQTCWITGYPDLNAANGAAQDYMCGPSASDGDVFMHIGLPDVSSIPLNIAVLAAEAGKVADASDGIVDRIVSSKAEIKTGTPNCGNGVIIDHGMGLETAYCHLKQGSLRVHTGDVVRKGDIIGFAGQSGVAFWPELAFSIRSGGFFVDPVTGASFAEGCGLGVHPKIALPAEFTRYQPAAIVSLGFSNAPVSANALITGQAPRFAALDASETTINLWGMVLGVHVGDEIEIRLRDPRGRTFYYQDLTADSDLARMPINATRSRGYVNWRTGTYSGEIKITRKVENRDISVSRVVTLDVD